MVTVDIKTNYCIFTIEFIFFIIRKCCQTWLLPNSLFLIRAIPFSFISTCLRLNVVSDFQKQTAIPVFTAIIIRLIFMKESQ